MSELLRPRNLIAGTVIGAIALFGADKFIDYEATQAGRRAGDEFISTVESSDVGQQKVAELKDLLRDEFTADWLAEQLHSEGIDGQWLIETVAGNETP